jgi:hypothetical protein
MEGQSVAAYCIDWFSVYKLAAVTKNQRKQLRQIEFVLKKPLNPIASATCG